MIQFERKGDFGLIKYLLGQFNLQLNRARWPFFSFLHVKKDSAEVLPRIEYEGMARMWNSEGFGSNVEQ
jgi:hypothetical protein